MSKEFLAEGPKHKPTCEHPSWVSTDDGHGGNSGWRCTTCGHWQWIAPWVMNRKNDWPDVS